MALNRHYERHSLNITKMQEYYKVSYKPIDLTNPILRLVYLLDWGDVLSPSGYYNKARDKEEELCFPIGITTFFNTGNVHTGFFWGKEIPSSIATTHGNSTDMFGTHWSKLTPVKVQHVPNLTGSLTRPDLTTSDKGYGSITVDVALLAFMFRKWQVINEAKPLVDRERPEHFVARYVFPNMMVSNANAILTRGLWATEEVLDGIPAAEVPLALQDVTEDIALGLIDLTTEIGGNATYEQYLSNLPAVGTDSLLEAFPLMAGSMSQAKYWTNLAGSLSLLNAASNGCIDNPEWSQLRAVYKRSLRRIHTERTLRKIPNGKFRWLVTQEFESFTSLLLE